jgi:hypothetical protein
MPLTAERVHEIFRHISDEECYILGKSFSISSLIIAISFLSETLQSDSERHDNFPFVLAI